MITAKSHVELNLKNELVERRSNLWLSKNEVNRAKPRSNAKCVSSYYSSQTCSEKWSAFTPSMPSNVIRMST